MTAEEAPPRRDGRLLGTVSFRLLVAANRLTAPFADAHGRRFGLALSDWRCLMALSGRPDLSGRDVAALMAMEPMTVSRALRRQERRGRVARAPDPRNRRRDRWRLTDEGWSVVDAILPDALARDALLFAEADEAEHAALARLLARLDPPEAAEGRTRPVPETTGADGGGTPDRDGPGVPAPGASRRAVDRGRRRR